MSRASSIRAMVSREIKQAAPVRQHRDGPRHKESDLLMPSVDPMGVLSGLVPSRPQPKLLSNAPLREAI
jgi:hypothetical protein